MEIGEARADVEKDSDFVYFREALLVVRLARLKSGEKVRQDFRLFKASGRKYYATITIYNSLRCVTGKGTLIRWSIGLNSNDRTKEPSRPEIHHSGQ